MLNLGEGEGVAENDFQLQRQVELSSCLAHFTNFFDTLMPVPSLFSILFFMSGMLEMI